MARIRVDAALLPLGRVADRLDAASVRAPAGVLIDGARVFLQGSARRKVGNLEGPAPSTAEGPALESAATVGEDPCAVVSMGRCLPGSRAGRRSERRTGRRRLRAIVVVLVGALVSSSCSVGGRDDEWVGPEEAALRFDRLGVPKKIERIESDLKNNRIADPERLIPVLDKILSDQRIMNYARDHAGKMKEQILSKKLGRSNR